MDVNRIIQVSSFLSNQQLAQQVDVAVLKLANDQIELQGESVMQLIEALPAPSATVGQIINIQV
jgi:hypothetical protein